MERIPEKIDFDEVYSLYEGRRDKPRQSVDIESINISDRKGLQDRMNNVVQNAASLYQQIGEDSPDGVLKDWPELLILNLLGLLRLEMLVSWMFFVGCGIRDIDHKLMKRWI